MLRQPLRSSGDAGVLASLETMDGSGSEKVVRVSEPDVSVCNPPCR